MDSHDEWLWVGNGLGNQQKDNNTYFREFGNNILYFGVQLMDLPNDDSCCPIWLAMRHESVPLSCIAFWTIFLVTLIIFAWHIKCVKEIQDY